MPILHLHPLLNNLRPLLDHLHTPLNYLRPLLSHLRPLLDHLHHTVRTVRIFVKPSEICQDGWVSFLFTTTVFYYYCVTTTLFTGHLCFVVVPGSKGISFDVLALEDSELMGTIRSVVSVL